MSHYRHLTIKERECLWELVLLGKSLSEIALIMGRSKSTISRELKRGTARNEKYSPSYSQERYDRIKSKPRRRKLHDPVLRDHVRDRIIKHQESPEQISALLPKYGMPNISHNTIYRAIYDGIMEGKYSYKRKGKWFLNKKLRHKGKKYKRGALPRRKVNNIDRYIDERPEAANKRTEIGHWEGDTVHVSRSDVRIVTLVDRHSKFLLAASQPNNETDPDPKGRGIGFIIIERPTVGVLTSQSNKNGCYRADYV